MLVSGKRKEGLAKCTNKVQKLYLYIQGSASFLKDSANRRRHAVCRSCGITLHSRCKQTYYTHKNESCKALKKQRQGCAHESPKTNLTAQTFLSKALPCLGAQANLSTEGLLKFVSAYEGACPDISPDQIISKLPCAKKFHLSEKGLATEIWELVHKTVSESAFFGIAVDGGIDNVKHQNILVSVLYAGANSFVLPPIYHKRFKAFNGIEMAKSIVSMLRSGLGDGVQKLRYFMVDGCGVNHVARQATERELRDIYDRISPVGTEDVTNVCNGIRMAVPCVKELSCFGHILNLIAGDTIVPYQSLPVMCLRDAFAHIFWSGGKPSAKKGKYMGRAIEEILCSVDEETRDAVQLFSQWYQILGDINMPDEFRSSHVNDLCSALEIIKNVCVEPVQSLLVTLRGNGTFEEKHFELVEKGPLIMEAVERTKRINKVPAPKLGGATRWCTGRFESLQYIAENLPTITRFVYDEVTSGNASDFIKKCAEIIKESDPQDLMGQAREILKQLEVVHKSLKQLSDMPNEPMALVPYPILQRLKSESEKENANPELIKSLQKDKQRLENKAYTYYWCAVMSFSPLHIFLSRKHPTAQYLVISVDVANDVFQSGEPLFHISEDEWNSYINCKNFDWQPSVHTSVWKWWEDVGKENFPSKPLATNKAPPLIFCMRGYGRVIIPCFRSKF